MDISQYILDAIEDEPGISSGDLNRAVHAMVGKGGTNSTVREARNRLSDDGWIVRVDIPLEGGHVRHAWFLADPDDWI